MSLALAGSGFSGPLIAGLAIDHLGTRLAFGLLTLGPLLSAGGLACCGASSPRSTPNCWPAPRKPSAAA